MPIAVKLHWLDNLGNLGNNKEIQTKTYFSLIHLSHTLNFVLGNFGWSIDCPYLVVAHVLEKHRDKIATLQGFPGSEVRVNCWGWKPSARGVISCSLDSVRTARIM